MLALPIKYPGAESTGVPFAAGETRLIVVTAEALDIATGYEGDTVEYTATVKDSEGEAIPATFLSDLIINATKVITDQIFDAAHYDPVTFKLTLSFVVPALVGDFTVKLSWLTQII